MLIFYIFPNLVFLSTFGNLISIMVGRDYEIRRLQDSLKSDQSELIAVFGRRRVGKTFLIRNVYQSHFRFELTGLYGGNKKQQLEAFFDTLNKVSKKFSLKDRPKNWKQAFDLLKDYLSGLRGKEKKVIFFDEMPWLDTHKSDFRMYFGHFWNTFCEKRNDLVVVVCGSAASYMVKNVVSNKGSLHARITYKLQIKPFTLYEAQLYLESKNIYWGHYYILHLYLAIGGIPQYLSKIVRGESVVQAVQRLCFSDNGDLVNEFEDVFESLFAHSVAHKAVVRALGSQPYGIGRDELIKQAGHPGGGAFTRTLDELIASGFVTKYPAFDKKSKNNLFRLTDEYSRFYLKFMEPNKNQGENFWKTMYKQQSYISWAGFGFEGICIKHVAQIKKALKIEGIHSANLSWSSKNAQIDLVIKRDDRWINLCEMKFHSEPYSIGKSEYDALRNKLMHFKQDTATRDVVALTLISTFGTLENSYFQEIVENSFTMDVLFESA